MIVMQAKDVDLSVWLFFKKLLAYLDVAGMSSEDSEVRTFCGQPRNIYRVRLCTWRAAPITEYLRQIDETGQGLKRTNASPRIRDGPEGRSAPPKGLPRKMYDNDWFSQQHANYIEELDISGDVWEFLQEATQAMQ